MKKVLGIFYLAGVIGIFTFLFLADWIAPYSADWEDRTFAFQSPQALHFGKLDNGSLALFVCGHQNSSITAGPVDSTGNCSSKIPLVWKNGIYFAEPTFLLGSDGRGRDLFSRILLGTRLSLGLAFLGSFVAGSLGLFFAALAGLGGARMDSAIMRVAEFIMMLPGIYLLLILRSILPTSMPAVQVAMLIILTLAGLGWAGIARVMRGMIHGLNKREYIQSSRMLGRGSVFIFLKHMLPLLLPIWWVQFSVFLPGFLMTESALSLLGLGIQEPAVSLGLLLNDCLSVAKVRMYPWILTPAIILCGLSYFWFKAGDFWQEQWHER